VGPEYEEADIHKHRKVDVRPLLLLHEPFPDSDSYESKLHNEYDYIGDQGAEHAHAVVCYEPELHLS
jgi:hypothetical protein